MYTKEEFDTIVNQQNWKITSIITGFSVGILAFSIQTLKIGETYYCKTSLYISWGCLFVAFLAGLCRLWFLHKKMNYHYKIFNADKTFENKPIEKKEKKIKYWNRMIEVTAVIQYISMWFLLLGFIFGVPTYAIFKICNLE